MKLVRLRERGQLTLPSEIRRALKLETGDYLEVQIQGDAVVLKPKKIVDRERLPELIRKGRGHNRGVDPGKIEAEVAEAVERQKGEREADRDIKEGRISEPMSLDEMRKYFEKDQVD